MSKFKRAKIASIEDLRSIGSVVVRQLRQNKLSSGKVFIIYSSALPADQSYAEYPDHSIKVVTASADTRSFNVVRELTPQQAAEIRQEYNLG